MVAKGKASAKRKQQKEEEQEAEKQEQEQKRSKKQEKEEQQEESEDADAAAADGSEDEDEDLGEFEEGEDDDEDSSEGEPGNAGIFEAELNAREEELGKHCIVVGALSDDEEGEGEDEEEEKQPSLDQLRSLSRVFVPKKVLEYYQELAEALAEIGNTDDEEEDDEGEDGIDPKIKAMMKANGWGIRMLSTRHSQPMQQLLKASLAKADKAIKSNQWEEGFCHWAATVQAARRETHWFADTEEPEVAESIYEKLRTQWLKLQKHSDQELGGLVVEGSAASTKEAFNGFLQALADDMRGVEMNVKDVVKS